MTSNFAPPQTHARRTLLHFPVGTLSDWVPQTVRNALDAHEGGWFADSALLADFLRRDDRIFATLDTRVLGAIGLPFCLDLSDDTSNKRKAKKIRDRVHAWWLRTIPETVLHDLLRWVVLMGFCLAEIVWVAEKDEYRPTLVIHHPGLVSFEYWADEPGWYLRGLEGPVRVTPGDGQWVLFSNGADRPWMNGAIRALAIPWLVRFYARRDWARRSEIEGIGVRKAGIPQNADDKTVRSFLQSVQQLGSETTLRLPPGYTFEISALNVSAADGFDRLIASCDSAITLAMLGQNLTTQIEGGSYAAANVHAKVQLDRLEADVNGLSTLCRDQIIKWWGRYNVEGWDDDWAPWPRWDPTPPEDRQKRAQTVLTLSQALPACSAAGVDIDPLLEELDLERVEDAPPAPVTTEPAPLPIDPSEPAPADAAA